MGIVFRQSIKTTIVIFAGALLGALVNLGYVYVLSKQAVGFIGIIFAQAAVFQFLVLFGTSGTVITFIQRYTSQSKQYVLLTLSALAPLACWLLLLIPYILLHSRIIGAYQPADQPFISRYYYWIPLLVLLWSYMTQMESYLITQHKSAVANFMREVLLKLINMVLIGLMWYHLITFHAFIIASIVIYALPTIILLPIAMRTKAFGFSTKWTAFTGKEYKELLRFSWYHLLVGVSVFTLGQLDRSMLGIYSKNGLSALAVYTIAVFITSMMTAPFRAMTVAAFPTLNNALTSNDPALLRHIYRRSAINMLIVAVAMAAIVGCNLHNAVAILPKGKGFEAVAPLVLIMIVGRLVDMATGLNTELIVISPYYRFNFYVSVLLVVLLILFNRLLIPEYDIYGAAWGTSLALIIFNLLKMIFLWMKMRIQPFGKESALIIFAGMVCTTAGWLFPVLPNAFLDAFVRTGVILGVLAAMLFWLKPSEDLRAYIKSVMEKKRLF